VPLSRRGSLGGGRASDRRRGRLRVRLRRRGRLSLALGADRSSGLCLSVGEGDGGGLGLEVGEGRGGSLRLEAACLGGGLGLEVGLRATREGKISQWKLLVAQLFVQYLSVLEFETRT
jgi:hypothetical protein